MFDEIVKLASEICRTPMAYLSFMDEKRQWFKASYGMVVKEIPREDSICEHTIRKKSVLVVNDASRDRRFKDKSFVREKPGIRFYAGVSIVTAKGFAVGTLCVLDKKPRELTDIQRAKLIALKGQVVNLLELRLKNRQLEKAQQRLKQANIVTQKNYDRFRRIFEESPLGRALVNRDAKPVYSNKALQNLLGYSNSELRKMTFTELTYEKDVRKDLTLLKRLQKGKIDQFTVEKRLVHKNGDLLWVNLTVFSLLGKNEKFRYFVYIVQDITERKKIEGKQSGYGKHLEETIKEKTDQIRKKHQKLKKEIVERRRIQKELEGSYNFVKKVLENISNAVFVLDNEGHFQSANHQLEVITGYTEKDLLYRPIKILFSTEMNPRIQHLLYRVLYENAKIIDFETEFICKNNDKRYILLSVIPLEKDGQIQIVGSASDITLQKMNEIRLKHYAHQLQQSNRDLEEFAFVASHDLKEPLRKISAFSSRLIEKYSNSLDEAGIDYLHRLYKASLRMQKLVSDLLTYSQINSRRGIHVKVDLNWILQNVVVDLEIMRKKTSGKIKWSKLPSVLGDPTQLHQLFLNLISNSLKYHKPNVPPEVEISCQFHYKKEVVLLKIEEKVFCEVSIRDNGIGFDEKYSERIFQPFQRLHGKTEYEGTGMGLSICRKIIQRHGGRISANSKLGEGSVFSFTLPVYNEKFVGERHESFGSSNPYLNR